MFHWEPFSLCGSINTSFQRFCSEGQIPWTLSLPALDDKERNDPNAILKIEDKPGYPIPNTRSRLYLLYFTCNLKAPNYLKPSESEVNPSSWSRPYNIPGEPFRKPCLLEPLESRRLWRWQMHPSWLARSDIIFAQKLCRSACMHSRCLGLPSLSSTPVGEVLQALAIL